MLFQVLCNTNWHLTKFKRLGVSASSGHLIFWHRLRQKVRQTFQSGKPLLSLLPSQALQPPSRSLRTTSRKPPLQISWRHPPPSSLFWTLAWFFSPALKAMFFSFQFHDRVIKPSFYDFPLCSESANNAVTLYGLGASPVYRLWDEHFQSALFWLLHRGFHAMPEWTGTQPRSSATRFMKC